MLQAACYVPASIVFAIPQKQNLSGVLRTPLRAWDYPSGLPFVPKKALLAGTVHNVSQNIIPSIS